MNGSPLHALTIDLEDWHHLVGRRMGAADEPTNRILRQTDLFLDLCEAHGARATFFVVGLVAEKYPELIRRIAQAGHEIASHGHRHLVVQGLSRNEFINEAGRGKAILEGLTGLAVSGYRAPEFSIGPRTMWALDVLAELGFEYDSSIQPIRHRRYGFAGFNPAIVEYRLPSGATITEMPLATVPMARMRVPVAGGGYFRLLPGVALRRAFGGLDRAGFPIVTYFHPYEFDSERLVASDAIPPNAPRRRMRSARITFLQNLGRRSVSRKLREMLCAFRFSTCKQVLHETSDRRSWAVLR